MPENKFTNFVQKLIPRKHPTLWQIVFGLFAIALAVAAFLFARSFVAGWSLTSLPGVSVKSSTSGTPPAGLTLTPAAPEVELPPPWDGGSRVNILFFGLRGGETSGEDCPLCTDTIIVFTIDPISKTAGLLSIPRDMWVNIPGSGYSRINTAYSIGEGERLPGGGPGLAMKTVEQFLGVPIQYYAQVDFNTFVEAIDEIGGIDVQVEKADKPLKNGKYCYRLDTIGEPGAQDHFVVCPGLRHMDGQRALAFARYRYSEGGDIDRAKRQQAVILAIRNKVFSAENFPKLIAQAPQLYNIFSAGIHTNLSLDDMLKLAVLAQQISPGEIKTGVIDYTMSEPANVTLGGVAASVSKPFPDKIRELRDEIFTSTGPTSPIAQGDPAELMKSEGAAVSIANASLVNGMAQQTASYLLSQGMNVIGLQENASQSQPTVIVLHSAKLYTLRYLYSLFNGYGGVQLRIEPDSTASVDVEIHVGSGWASNNPMPPG
jgi:LCP family protein required for cell wall assembly